MHKTHHTQEEHKTMAKKYTQPAQNLVNDTIAEATTPTAAADQATQEGAKEKKTDRVNLALYTENYDYIRTMARVTGSDSTKFVNKIIEQHRQANAELYEKAKAFRAALDEFKF